MKRKTNLLRCNWLALALILMSEVFASRASFATQSLTLSSPQGRMYAGETLKFKVTGDNLRRVSLRIYRLKGTTRAASSSGARTQVLAQNLGSSNSRSQMIFRVTVGAPGWYQAEARADNSKTAFDEVTFSLAKRPAKRLPIPTLQLEGPSQVNPPGNATFSATGDLLRSATLRAWKLAPGGAQSLVYETNKMMPSRPPKTSKHYDEYEPVIRWSAPLQTPGVYLLEATSNRNLKRLKYVRVSDIGLVSKRAPHEILVYAIRLSSGAPIPNAAIRLDDSGVYETRTRKNGAAYQVEIRKPQPSRALSTQRDGVARFYNTPNDGTLKVSASAADGSRVYNHEAFLQNAGNSDLKVLFYTERPIYRPGQTVYFKGVARRDLSLGGKRGPNGALFIPVKNAKVKLEFTDAANEKFATLNLKTNDDGAFTGQIKTRSDAPVGRYSVETFLRPINKKTDESFYNRFLVQEYRKPEYEVTLSPQLDAPFAIQGTPVKVLVRAKYFFGTPVKSANLEYSGAENGSVKLDENGEAIITVSNSSYSSSQTIDQNGSLDRTLTLKAKVTDDANRIVESETSFLSAWAQVRPTIGFDKGVYNVQDTTKITVKTRDPLARAVAAKARVKIFYTRRTRFFNRETRRNVEGREEVAFITKDVQTDAFGTATFEARLGRAGYLRAEVSATDNLGRTSKSETHFWSLSKVQTRGYYWGEYQFPNIEITPDKSIYQPGETVRALVTTNKESGYVLLTLQGDRIFFHRVVKLNGRVNVVEFVYPQAAAPGAHLVAGTSNGREWSQDTAYLKAISPAQKLNIQISHDKNEYRPGARAKYSVLVKDGTGKPQRADVSLGLVDKAIYGLALDETPDAVEFFYGARENLVSTSWQFPGEVQGGSYQRIEAPVPVRRNFQDTAYWNPFVITDANGKANLEIPLPDNLTTWRATARAFTTDTKAGVVTDEILVTKPLLTRLIVPRFLTQTDKIRAQVIVQNNLTKAQNVKVSLHSKELSTQSEEEVKGAQTKTIPAGSSASFYWMIGTDEVPVGKRASLVATARTGDKATSEDSDAQEIKFPIQPRGFPIKKWASAIVRDGARTLALKQADEFVPNASTLKINLSPSVAGPMLSALPSLIEFPYGCTEQTLNRLVPAMVAVRATKQLKLPLPESAKKLPEIVEAARSTLYSYQHSDGGWGWWPDDDTDPYMTAYAIYGLSLAKENGYDFERARIQRGLTAMQNRFGDATSPDGRAFMMLAYATAIDVWNFDAAKELGAGALDYPNAVFEFRAKLSNYGLASLALAHERLVRAGLGNEVAQNAEATVVLTADAATYYLWNMQSAKEGYKRMYRSHANGKWYWRDVKTGVFHWLTVPEKGIAVNEKDAEEYQDFIGYNGSAEGQAFTQKIIDEQLNLEPKAAPKSTPVVKPVNPKTETYRAHLSTLLDELEAKATRENGQNGAIAFWKSESENTGWNDSDIEASALALQALVRARPQSNLIQPALNWLLQVRRGDQWRSTKDTSQVVIALAEYLQTTNELDADETVRVLVNGREVKTLHFTKADIGKPDTEIVLDGFNEDAKIEIQRAGKGVVYVSSQLVSYSKSTLQTGKDNGFKVSRRYQIRNEKGKWRDVAGPIPSGVLVRVDLRVEVTRAYQYLLLEDFMPSGFEARLEDDKLAQLIERKCDCGTDDLVVVDPPPGWSALPVSRREGRDNRQAWFVDYLPYDSTYNNGKYFLRYILRPEQPGTRVASPARIEAMYRPDFNGHSSENSIEVK